MASPKILVAPLDWGLGHAARCVPLVRALLNKKAEVILAGTGISGKLLQTEFPQLTYHEIPGYEVTYSTKSSMAITMLRQAPAILRAIQQEKKWLEEFLQNNQVDVVISDHRYGLHNKKVKCVFMAHQLFISSGSNDLLEPVLWKVNRTYIENFDECWIPDLPGEQNASGKLSHKQEIPFPHRFIGLLSRLNTTPEKKSDAKQNKYKAAFILSGLEPLRTEFEHIIIEQMHEMNDGQYILLRGTEINLKKDPPSHLEVIHMADSNKTTEIIQNSEIMISRSGYSSIMDYLVTGSKALLIPTPGQTEQEYLAKYHFESGNFYSVSQNELQLKTQLPLALTYSPSFSNASVLLENAILRLYTN